MFQLNPGDRIRIIATSGIVDEVKLQHALNAFQQNGFEVVLSKHLFDKDRYLAGSSQDRVNDLHEAFQDQKAKSIICAKGGYGCTQMLPMIDYDLIKKNKKALYGFSDTTAIQLALYKKCNLISISGLSIVTDYKDGIKPNDNTWLEYNQLIKNEHLTEKALTPLKSSTTETINGQLIGGCLSMIVSLMGTPWQADLKDNILFIEEVGEEPYRVDRLLTQLQQSADFKDLKAIIFGKFHNCKAEYDFHGDIETVLEKFSNMLNTPCFKNETYGHQLNRTLIAIGANCQIKNNSLITNL